MTNKTVHEILNQTKIYQILRPKCVSAPPDISVQEALELMHRERSGYVVLRDEHLRVQGVFTERDVLMKVLCRGIDYNSPVSRFMNTDLVALSKENSILDAINTMKKYNIRHIPLADELGQMTGVLSVRTVANFLSELFPTEVYNLPPKSDQTFDTAEGG